MSVLPSSPDDSPGIGFISIKIRNNDHSKEQLRSICLDALSHCRGEFTKAFRLKRIRQYERGGNNTIPLALTNIVLLLSYDELPAGFVNGEKAEQHDSNQDKVRSAYYFKAEDIFSKTDLNVVFDTAVRVTPGWSITTTEEGSTKIVLLDVPDDL